MNSSHSRAVGHQRLTAGATRWSHPEEKRKEELFLFLRDPDVVRATRKFMKRGS